MKKLSVINLMLVVVLILGACGTSNDVVSNRLISKRKYNKGFHINKKGKFKDSKENIEQEDLKSEESTADLKLKTKRSSDKKVREAEVVSEIKEYTAANAAGTEEYEYASTSSMDYDPLDEPEFNEEETEMVSGIQNETTEDTQDSSESASNAATVDTGDPLMLILAIILCLILPPVAIAVFDGISGMFWIDLILFLIAIGGWWLAPAITGICGLAAVVLAFLVIFGVI